MQQGSNGNTLKNPGAITACLSSRAPRQQKGSTSTDHKDVLCLALALRSMLATAVRNPGMPSPPPSLRTVSRGPHATAVVLWRWPATVKSRPQGWYLGSSVSRPRRNSSATTGLP